ncbi:MAG: hypothetical protein WDN46_05265 [Methylocella sp.]
MAQDNRVTVVDGLDGAVLGHLDGIVGGSHGVAISASTGKGFTDDGKAGTAIPFDLRTLEAEKAIAVGADADTAVIDPVTDHLFIINGDPGTISVIDLRALAVIQTIIIGGKLEFAVADGEGHLFVNGEAKREIVRIDTRTGRIEARWGMPDCVDPHGLAIDPATRRLFSGCTNERMVVMDSISGAIVATVPIGRGSDGVAFDPKRRRILSANGLDGTLSVIREVSAEEFVPLEAVQTMVSGRTLTVDPDSGRIYIAAAETDPAEEPGGRAVPRPGTLRLLFLDPMP